MKRLLGLWIILLVLVPSTLLAGWEGMMDVDWSGELEGKDRLSFFSALTSTQNILSPPRAYPGTAGTFTSASAQYFTDYQGVIQSVAATYPAVEGSRVVGNTCYDTDASGNPLPKPGDYPERQNSTAYTVGQKVQANGWWYECTTGGTSHSSAPTWATGKAGLVTVTDGGVTWTLCGRLLLGYVSEGASTNKTTAYGLIPADTLGSELATGTLTVGQKYQITARTDADFTADGAADNVVGTQFVATAATVTLDAGDKVKRVQWGVGEKSYYTGTAFQQNITGLVLEEGTSSIVSIASNVTEINNSGLSNINPTDKIYEFDNSAGADTATLVIAGPTGNTNPHSYYVLIRGGTGLTRLIATGAAFAGSASYIRHGETGVIPSSSTRAIRIVADAGQTLYFLLPQLEEQPLATSINPSLGATSTRAATVLSYPIAGNIPTTGPWTMKLSFVPEGVSTTTTRYLWSSYTDANNYTALLYDGTTLTFRKRVAGTNYDATKALTAVANTAYNAVIRRNTDGSLDLFCQAAKGTGQSDTTTPVLATAFQVGSSNSVSQFGGWVKDVSIYAKQLTDSRCIALAP